MPAPRRGARARAHCASASSQPSRIFSVTGTPTAPTVASIKVSAWSRSRISAEPDCAPVTCLAGQPMLMSMMSAPASCGDARAFGHPVRLAAGELHDVEAAAPRRRAGAAASRLPSASAALAIISEIDDAGAETCGEPAEGRIGDAGHRREEHAIRQRDRPDGQRSCRNPPSLEAVARLQCTLFRRLVICLEFSHFASLPQVLRCSIYPQTGQMKQNSDLRCVNGGAKAFGRDQ